MTTSRSPRHAPLFVRRSHCAVKPPPAYGAHGISPTAVCLMRCEKRDGRIPPIVNAARWAILRIELEDGKKLDSGNAKVLEIRNLLDESAKCATNVFCDAGTRMPRESLHMHFVDDGLRGGTS